MRSGARVLGRAHFCWWVCGFSENVSSFGCLFGLLVRLGEENEEFFFFFFFYPGNIRLINDEAIVLVF